MVLENQTEGAFVSVTFPSKQPSKADTRNVIETEEPFIAEPGDEVLWEFRVYIPHLEKSSTRGDDEIHITETIIGVKEPLYPGQLKILRGWIGKNNEIISDSREVSTSVTLDWQDGLVIRN